MTKGIVMLIHKIARIALLTLILPYIIVPAAAAAPTLRGKRLLIGAFLSPMRVRNSSGSLHRLHRDKVLE